ncbi:MAG TPA: SDR family NAD(P)-dependent oxidoreductase [Micromonosporaceae bacterium]
MPVLHQLIDAREIEEFAEAYHRASGYPVPLDYLHRCLVFGMRRRGRLIGGVVVTGEAPLRTFARIPQPHRAAVEAAVDGTGTVELACVWIDRAHRSGLRSALFWYGLFLESGRRGARHVVFGTESESLRRMYLLGRPQVLYQGPVTVDGQQKQGTIFYSPVSHRWPALLRMTGYKMGPAWLRRRLAAVPPSDADRDVRSPGGVQADTAAAVPLRGLAVASGELVRGLSDRVSRRQRVRARAALGAAACDGFALVTGASSGIGLAYARQLAARGAGLLLVADEPEVESVAARLREEYGVRTDALVIDLSAEAAVDKVVSWVGQRRVEVLVNNAGTGVKGPFVAGDTSRYEHLIRVNLTTPVLLTLAFLPSMAGRGRGAVVHVASVNALSPMPRSAVYSATKTFLLTYATAIWYENRRRGVVFQTLLPGTTATRFHDRQHTDLPGWAAAPDRVAATSLARLGRHPVCVPGVLNQVFRALGAILPLRARTAAAGEALRASLGVRD